MIGVPTVSLFYALLALVANAAVIGLVALAVAARRSSTAARWPDGLRSSFGSSRTVEPRAMGHRGRSIGGRPTSREGATLDPR